LMGAHPWDPGADPILRMNASKTLLALAASLPTALSAATVNLEPSADTFVVHRDGNAINGSNFGASPYLDTTQFGGGIYSFIYVRFDLTAIPAGSVITGATLTFTKTANSQTNGNTVSGGGRNDTLTTARFATYGLLDAAGNTAQDWSESTITWNNVGAEQTATTNTQFDTATRTVTFDGVNETVTGGLTASISSSVATDALSLFLQGRLDASTHTGLTTFIVDLPSADASARGYGFASNEHATDAAPLLSITYTTVPEPGAALLGAFGILGLLRRRRGR
jgi:hypothetical protein